MSKALAARAADQLIGAAVGALMTFAALGWSISGTLRSIETRLSSVERKVDQVTELRVRERPAQVMQITQTP